MKVRYLYSACVEIETPKLRILCDPWFSEGAFDGSWYYFPKVKKPINIIKKPDLIYISHIHSDHYDPEFLKKINKKFGKRKIIIANFRNNYLLKRIKFDKLDAEPIRFLKSKNVNINIVPNETGSVSDVDSAMIVNHKQHTILSLVDCVYDKKFANELKKIVSSYTNELDLLMAPHAGANNFPHTYFDNLKQKEILKKLTQNKKSLNFSRYINWCKLFKSKYHLPYAGKYLIGGKNVGYNKFSGMGDAIEIKKFDKRAIILTDYGGEINLSTKKIKGERKKKYKKSKIRKYLSLLKNKKYSYEKEIFVPFQNINFPLLIKKSYIQAVNKSEVSTDYYYLFKLFNNNKDLSFSFRFNINNKKNPKIYYNKSINKKPGNVISIDYRLFYGLLTGIYHWNNASIGSLYKNRRVPLLLYNKKASNFLNFFSIA